MQAENTTASDLVQVKGITINCVYDDLVPIEDLKPNPLNPNVHPQYQIEKLAGLLKAHGWRIPITVSILSGQVVSGHARLEAARLLAMHCVPVDYQDFDSKSQEYAVLVADNAIADLASFDNVKLAEVLKELENVDYPLELTAFDTDQLKDFQSSQPQITSSFFDDDAVKKVRTDPDRHSITFTFEMAQAKIVESAIKRKGKPWVVAGIFEMCLGVQNA
ncbi:MAG: hypothetical protein A2Y12_03650 [Planctomycetes bacterium GWF2_42_9]|nr:MAG: hypothetical protein A2Y12_03650 [Planctomycetes bacterium GWF2_42_9]